MDQTDKMISKPKINIKENSRSEIWHCFGYKTVNDELTLLHLYKSVAIGLNHFATSNLFKHLSFAHPDLFRELRHQQVSASLIN